MVSTFRKIMTILTLEERKKLRVLLLLDIIISIADILFLTLLLIIVQFYTGSVPASKFSFLFSGLIDRHSLWPVIVFFLLFSIKNLAGFLVYRAQCRYLFNVASRISKNKLLQYLEGAWSGYINTDSSMQIREISYQPMEFCQHVLGSMQQIITQTILILLTVIAIVSYNAKLFILLLVILLPPTFVVFYLIRSRVRSVGANVRNSSEKSLQYLREALAGYVESNIYDRNRVFLDRYSTRQEEYNRHLSDHVVLQGIPSRMIEIFALLGIVVLLTLHHWSGETDNSAILTIGVFMAAAYKIIPGIVKILNLSGQINTYAFSIRNLAPDLVPGENVTSGSPPSQGAADPAQKILSIAFDKVKFSYGDRIILNNQDLQIRAGDFIGIAGPSGKGKTTILNLLLGFLAPDKGNIMINDRVTDIRERRGYWRYISYVKQQPFLVHDTILQNITLNGRSCDEQKFREALDVSGLTAMINGFPEKRDQIIAENGKNISGGQRQRIAFARALYKDADLLILDEPFSELDEASERGILEYCRELTKKGKAVVLITHNKINLSLCHKIISLDE
jgi:ABC-type multidrug transport system fused ATPase/permease subunit